MRRKIGASDKVTVNYVPHPPYHNWLMALTNETVTNFVILIDFPSSLKKKVDERANYLELLEHVFLVNAEKTTVDVSGFVTDILDNFGIQR